MIGNVPLERTVKAFGEIYFNLFIMMRKQTRYFRLIKEINEDQDNEERLINKNNREQLERDFCTIIERLSSTLNIISMEVQPQLLKIIIRNDGNKSYSVKDDIAFNISEIKSVVNEIIEFISESTKDDININLISHKYKILEETINLLESSITFFDDVDTLERKYPTMFKRFLNRKQDATR